MSANYNYIKNFQGFLVASNNEFSNYVQGLVTTIAAIPDCGTLNDIETSAYSALQAALSQVQSQVSYLSILTHPPTDIGSVIRWITTFINTSVLAPYENALALEVTVLKGIQTIGAAVESKYAGMSCRYQPLQGIVNNIKTTGAQLTGSALIGGF